MKIQETTSKGVAITDMEKGKQYVRQINSVIQCKVPVVENTFVFRWF